MVGREEEVLCRHMRHQGEEDLRFALARLSGKDSVQVPQRRGQCAACNVCKLQLPQAEVHKRAHLGREVAATRVHRIDRYRRRSPLRQHTHEPACRHQFRRHVQRQLAYAQALEHGVANTNARIDENARRMVDLPELVAPARVPDQRCGPGLWVAAAALRAAQLGSCKQAVFDLPQEARLLERPCAYRHVRAFVYQIQLARGVFDFDTHVRAAQQVGLDPGASGRQVTLCIYACSTP